MKPTANAMVTKSFDAEVKAVDDTSNPGFLTITGKASTFGNPDQTGDIIKQGAFTQTIAERNAERMKRGDEMLVPMLLNHDAWSHDALPIGSVTELRETDDALLMVGKIPMSDTRAANVRSQVVEARSMRGLSIGFFIQAQDRRGENRIIEKIKLREVSLTPFPANELAELIDAKSSGLSVTLEHLLTLPEREVESMLRSGLPLSQSGAKKFLSFLGAQRDVAKSNNQRDVDWDDVGSRPLNAELSALLKSLQ